MKKIVAIFAFACLFAGSSFAQEIGGAEERPAFEPYMIEGVDTEGNSIMIAVDPPAVKQQYDPSLDANSRYYKGEVKDELELFPGAAIEAATVPVYAVADEEYRSAYSNWQTKLNNIIETADNAYYRDFGINWVIQGYYSWTSNGNNSSQILSDLASDGSGLPNGLCQGFSKDSRFDAGGIAYVYNSNPGTGYSVCKDQGDSSTIYALRHEIGHNYGCSHDFDPVVCMMNYTYSYSIDYFDNAHKNTVSSHSGWFQ